MPEFHQTPRELAKILLGYIQFSEGDVVAEPFRGTGSFYDEFPENCTKEWAEIADGKDYTEIGTCDWVITNPPFKIDGKNSFFDIVSHFADKCRKGMAFLGNDRCLASLTPKRMKELEEKGFFIHKVILCQIKQWRGRYYFIVFKKEPTEFFISLPKLF